MKLKIIPLFIALSSCLICLSASAQESPVAGKVFSIQGTANIQRAGASIPVKEGASLESGDEIITGEPGRVAIELSDGSYMRLASGSRMKFLGEEKKVGFFSGALHFLSHSERHPIIETQQVTAAIRGTEFNLITNRSQTTITMFSGVVDASALSGQAHIRAGQGAHFKTGSPPEVFALLSSDKSVQWSMFVPFVEATDSTPKTVRATQLFQVGDITAALKLLAEDANQPICNQEGLLHARLILAGGDSTKGIVGLQRCSSAETPNSIRGEAQATLANVRLMQGDRASAESLSQAALRSLPSSDNSKISRSYVLQDKGDLTGALSLFDESNSDHAMARKAELVFMVGNVPEAKSMLESIKNRSWYAETVYGFVLMADRSFSQAEIAFNTAALMEPGAGLPRLGLGLIRVNRGDLAGGRKEIERATVLEPTRALYRSYLGKAYFEEDNYSGAHPEYQRALEIDPNDPTPHLYRSFMRVAENDLVGALDDLGMARKLSGNRNVYRSQFLLDQDSAMQSASIGRVYQQLGFKERGRLEAVTALTSDYTNPTAHRLLSQSQEDIFSADTVASEQRISNLFSPLSINVVDSIGTGVSLNEYSQLFERDGWRTASNNYFDSQDNYAKSGILSAYKNGNLVLGLSADGAIRDGISEDPRTSAGTVGFSLQAQPSWADRFLVEGRGIFSGSSDPEQSVDGLTGSTTAAYLHKFTPEITGVIQSSYDRDRESIYRPYKEDSFFSTVQLGELEDTQLLEGLFDQRSQRYETSVITEGQLIARGDYLTSILTLRNANNNVDSYDRSIVREDEAGELDGLGATLRSAGAANLSGNTASYLGDYSLLESLHIQFGGEFESVEWASQDEAPFSSNSTSKSLLSPKAGFVFMPNQLITIRAGYGESLGKGTRTDLVSIEPTMIGGINQRYNDLAGTASQNLGFGLDFHPRKSTFFGAEWSRRWLDENRSAALYEYVLDFNQGLGYAQIDLGENYDTPINQNFVNAYIYEVLSRNWVAGIDYRLALQDIRGEDPSDSRDHRNTAFTRYFFASGWFLQGSAAYRYQDRQNIQIYADGSNNGSDNAWFMGAGLGYRLPTRRGLILLDVQNIFGQDINIDQLTYFNEPVFNDPTLRLAANFNF